MAEKQSLVEMLDVGIDGTVELELGLEKEDMIASCYQMNTANNPIDMPICRENVGNK